MASNISDYVVLGEAEGLRLQSGPGRDLIFKVTGEDTGGAFDYFIVQVAPHGGPPLQQLMGKLFAHNPYFQILNLMWTAL